MDDNYLGDRLNIYTASLLTFGHGQKADNFSSMVFGEEYSLLKSGRKNAIIGLKNIALSSVVDNDIKASYLKQCFRDVGKERMCNYALQFLAKNKLIEESEKDKIRILLDQEYNKLKSMVDNYKPSKKQSLDDNDAIINARKNLEDNIKKNFSKSTLKRVNIERILSCKRLCVQNMDTLDSKPVPLGDERLEELRRLVHLYTGDKYVLINGLLRGKIFPLYDGDKLEKRIEKLKEETKKVNILKIYEGYDLYNDNYFVVPVDIYNKLRKDCYDLINAISESEKEGTFWRLMGTRGLEAMLSSGDTKYKTLSDAEIKQCLKGGTVESYFLAKKTSKNNKSKLIRSFFKYVKTDNDNESLFQKLSGILGKKIIVDKGFLSTSYSNGVVFPGWDEKAIVLKITGKFKGILVGKFTEYEGEKEFLMPPGTKLKIVSITSYDGKENKTEIEKECIQLNCINGD